MINGSAIPLPQDAGLTISNGRRSCGDPNFPILQNPEKTFGPDANKAHRIAARAF
jgi:hypothetical protein